MSAITTLFPVFAMIALGTVSRIKGWVTPQQKDGANHIVFNILFPIMIFNILLTAKVNAQTVFIVGYVFIAFCLTLFIGTLVSRFTGSKTAHFSPYLLTTVEGGNVALPLFTSIVGMAYASHTVIFDIAGSLLAFIIVPVLVAKSTAASPDKKVLLKQIFTNSFVIAVLAGLLLNVTGIYDLLSQSAWLDLYTKTVSQMTGPIVGMILFIIGYNLKINPETLSDLLKLLLVRLILFMAIIAGFFILFPELMADQIYMIAVLIYFMSPTGFAMPMLIAPLNKDEQDVDFQSAFISLYMIVTLVVYALIVIFIV